MQQRKTEIALNGNSSFIADNWLSRLMISAYEVADQIMVDSAEDNALRATYSSYDAHGASIPQAELMSSRYGSFGPRVGMSPRTAQCRPYTKSLVRFEDPLTADDTSTVAEKEHPTDDSITSAKKADSEENLLVSIQIGSI